MVVTNPQYLVKDLIDGDESVANRPDFLQLSSEEIKTALKQILESPILNEQQKYRLVTNQWMVNFRVKPPTIEEFLTEKYLGETAKSLYPYITSSMVSFWDPSKPYRNLILAPHIGWGKTLFSVISSLYVAVVLWCMRDPTKFFPGLSKSSVLVQVLISFTLDKARELLLEPFKRILITSPFFVRAKTEEQLQRKQRDVGNEKMVWTTAGTFDLQFSRGSHIKVASEADMLLGLTAITGTVSEISFFADRGFSYDEIWRVYSDMKKRIFSRFVGNYYARTVLDSSPNSMDNPIDRYIHGGEAERDSTNFVIKGAMWDWQPWKFDRSRGSFFVFKGNAAKPPAIIEEKELSQYDPIDVMEVPCYDSGGSDIRRLFVDDILKSLKDLGGVPAGMDDRLIQQREKIEEMFVSQLRGQSHSLYAPAGDSPDRLIWDQVAPIFFESAGDQYLFYRNPFEDRFLSVDQSITDDSTAIVMVHPELNREGEIVDVVDFSLVIQPRKSRINLEAIEYFVKDLVKLGRIRLKKVSFDRFQSETAIQNLNRAGIDTISLSVDAKTGPYLNFISQLYAGRVKAGRNIYLKNNLRSLRIVSTQSGKKKIDHLSGKNVKSDNHDWETSSLGYYAKDVSDALVAAIELRNLYFRGTPRYLWIPEETEEEKKKNLQKLYYEKLRNLGLRPPGSHTAGGIVVYG